MWWSCSLSYLWVQFYTYRALWNLQNVIVGGQLQYWHRALTVCGPNGPWTTWWRVCHSVKWQSRSSRRFSGCFRTRLWSGIVFNSTPTWFVVRCNHGPFLSSDEFNADQHQHDLFLISRYMTKESRPPTEEHPILESYVDGLSQQRCWRWRSCEIIHLLKPKRVGVGRRKNCSINKKVGKEHWWRCRPHQLLPQPAARHHTTAIHNRHDLCRIAMVPY